MRAATVLGAGELGKACALALAADGVSAVHVLTRDVNLASPATATLTSTSQATVKNATSSSTSKSIHDKEGLKTENGGTTLTSWPSAIRFCDVKKRTGAAAAAAAASARSGGTGGPLFLCTPITSYLAPDDAWATTALRTEHSPVTHAVLATWREHIAAPQTSAPPTSSSHFVCTFTRGFSADGAVAAQLADELLNTSQAAPSSVAAGLTNNNAIPVLVAAGPVLAREWAQQCTPLSSSADAGSSASTSSIPPRPRSALSGESSEGAAFAGGGAIRRDNSGVHAGKKLTQSSSLPGLTYPHAFSGAALTFATWTPSIHADSGRQDALAAQLNDYFPRESVTFLREPDAAAVLAIVNGCVPLCSFGAGLVSGVYAGASVTALAAYAQHAVSATEQLTNALLGRPAGTPLPIAAWSTLNCACTALTSREFALGRQLDFYFRKQDAMHAIFRGRTHQLFAATVDGLHTRMQGSGVTSPFYEVLMDTYNTLIRASRAGEGLVKTGYYDYSGQMNDEEGEGVLLRHAMRVDEAMLSGDDDRFAAAKERLVRAFPDAVLN